MSPSPRSPLGHKSPSNSRRIILIAASAAALGLAGCGATLATPSAFDQAASINGTVHGGQQPVSGALVSLIAPGTSGYGSAGTVLATATTAANGSFTLPRPYTCPSSTGVVYLLATGGNAGGGLNSLIAEAAVAGPCGSLTAGSFFNISEVTTVAAAYTLAPFATVTTGLTTIGTSATNTQGLNNAFGAASNLANLATGNAHVTADFVGIVPPTAELNTLADILSTCVNQGTPIGPAGSCATLFTDTSPSGGVAPTDTFQAAINLAKNPALNNTPLFNLVTASAPYQPTLTAAPGDFSLALGYNGGAITTGNGTICVVIDASGDAWITTGYPGTSTHALTEISPAGTYFSGSTVAATTGFGAGALSSPIGLVIDASGNFVVANNGGNNILKFNSSGSQIASFSSSSLGGPNGITVDAGGNTWVANYSAGADVTTIVTPAFAESSHSPLTTGAFGAVDVAAGPLAVWQTNHTTTVVSRIDLSTFAVTTANLRDTTAGVDIDHNNNAWVADTSTGNVFEITNAGVITGPQGGFVYPNGGVQSIAIDGLGNIFGGGYLSSTQQGALVEYNNSGTYLATPNGFYGSNVIPNLPQIDGIAIDGSGNVWIAGTNQGTTLPVYVAEVIGIAAPVVTPRVTAVINNTLGTRP
jgi:sugar lactone lactonase YvrE